VSWKDQEAAHSDDHLEVGGPAASTGGSQPGPARLHHRHTMPAYASRPVTSACFTFWLKLGALVSSSAAFYLPNNTTVCTSITLIIISFSSPTLSLSFQT